MVGIFVYVFVFFLSTLFFFLFMTTKKDTSQKQAKLPPGSMGWPYIGETLQLYSQDPNTFFAAKQKRYGEIFKTHILGCPCVMLASPEGAKFVLVTQAHLFKPTYPESKERLIGPSALFFHHGDYHIRLRKLVQASLSLYDIRTLVADIEALAASASFSWIDGQLINTFQEMKRYSFQVGVLSIFGHLDSRHKEELKKNYCIVDKGYNSFPTNIPGTPYKKALLVHLPDPETANVEDFVAGASTQNILDWLPQRDPQIQILNFLDAIGLLPLRDEVQRGVEILPPPSTLHRQNANNVVRDDHITPTSGLENDMINNNAQRPQLGQFLDVNLSSWTEFYPTEDIETFQVDER